MVHNLMFWGNETETVKLLNESFKRSLKCDSKVMFF